MKKSLLLSTLIAASFCALPAWATDYTFGANNTTSTADDLVAGGDGSQDNPYYFTECGSGNRVSITVSGDNSIFTASGTTVYLGSDTQSFGAAGVNSFFNGSVTAACDIVIGAAGIYITNGSSNQTHTFSGKISGTGDWTVSYYGTGNNQGSAVTQHYVFTGDLSGWTGNFTISTPDDDYVYFGNGGVAATNTNISGNGGSISVDYGEVRYNYSDYAEGTSASVLTVTNSSIEGHKVTFTGSVNYDVSSTITGWDASSGSVATTSSTLTVSNTGTTTFTGTVSNFDNVTVSSSSTLAIGTGGSLDLSNATVNLGSTIQNSGTVIINESTIFALDNLTYTGSLTSEEGATYTLITGSGSVTVDTSLLGLDNVSSSSEITSATFNYADGVLTVTVIELEDGLHGDGTSSSPYYTSGSGTLVLPTTGEGGIFAGDSSTTVYIATEDHSLGTADENVYWASGSFTAACNIVIGKAGIYLDNGYSGNVHTFTGAISGEGSWTINSSSVNQDYVFTGDLSQWSGDFTITGSSASYVCYGDGKTVAATATNVTGTGAISVSTGTIAFDYIKEDSDGNTGPSTITIGNSSITAATLEFMGDVAYSVDLSKTTVTTTTLNVGESATLLISGSGTLTESSSSSSIAVSGTLELASNVTLTITKNSHASTSVENLVLVNGSTLVQNANTANSSGTTDGQPVSKEEGLSIGTLTITSSDTSSTTGPSATIQNSTWHNYVGIGALVGTNATLTLTSDAASSVTNIYELGTSGNTSSESQFTGKISLSDTNTSGGRGVTLVISEEKIAAGAVIEMGAEVDKDTLALGVNAERVEIAGLVSGGSGNNGGDVVYSGEVSVGAALGDNGATLIDYKSQSGYGEGSKFDNVGTSRNTLVINTAEGAEYSFSGVVMDMLNLEKTGKGTQSIEFKSSTYGTSGYYFDGSIAVTEGTLNLSGVETNSAGITVAKDATLNIANHITLAATSDIGSVSSTISGTLNIAEGGQLDLAGTVTINNAISNSGSITIADGTSITVGVEVQTGEYSGTNYDYYTLIDGSNGSGSVTLGDSVTFVIDGTEITLSEIATLADGDTDWKGYISGGSLFIYAETSTTAETTDPLYWAGTDGNNTWSTSEDNTPWSASDTGNAGYYFENGESVIFGSSAAEVTTVTVSGEVVATTTTINGAYTFNIGDGVSVTTGSLTISSGGSLALTGAGKIVTGGESNSTLLAFDASNFTGEMDFTKGYLDIANSTFNSGATVVVTANTNTTHEDGYLSDTDVSLHIGNAESNSTSEFAASLVLEGDGGVIIRTGDSTKTVTFLGSVTGTNATLQLNGGGNAVFSGTVNVGTYLNFQGATTFSGATTLGKLEFFQNGDNASDVTFSGGTAKVTALVVDQSGGSLAANLTVSDGASLSVGTMAINHDFAITIDKAAMSITGTVTQTAGTTTSITISNGGQLSLGDSVSLNVDVMNIVLGTANYDESNSGSGTFAIVGGDGSSLTLTDSAAITITVDSALESLLSSEGTYYFDISKGIVLTEDNLDWSALTSYGTVSYSDGIISVVVGTAIPEPGMFSLFFSVGALGLVATRRRRRKAA